MEGNPIHVGLHNLRIAAVYHQLLQSCLYKSSSLTDEIVRSAFKIAA